MAKRNSKKRPALFDVMSAGKSLELPVTRSRPFVQAPSWWTRWKLHRARMAEARALRAEQMASMAPVEIAPAPRIETPRMEIKPEPMVSASTLDPTDAAPARKDSFGFKIDFTTGVIIVSGLVCFVGVTILIGQKITGSSVKPPVLAATENKPVPNRTVIEVRQPQQQQPSLENKPPIIDPQPPVASDKRVINMNYVVIQSFPDEKLAAEAAEFCNKNGVGCTVIQGLPRWTNRMQWYSIVGTKPFPPRSTGTTAYDAYVTQVRDLGVKFAGKSRWKQFEPQPYRWGQDSEK
jgi:hypothetical protein